MLKEIKPLHCMYKLNLTTLKMTLKDVSDEDFKKRPTENCNSLQWNFGHLTVERCHIIGLTGNERKNPWGDLFENGKPALPADQYPDLIELENEMEKISTDLLAHLENLDERRAGLKASYNFPTEDKSVLGGITFMMWHEGLHIGQMAYTRRLLSYPPVFG